MMEYRNLGRAGLKVTAVGLGTHYFGWFQDEPTATAIVNKAIDLGVNFFDTADAYDKGRSEEFLGRALKGRRIDMVIATKFAAPMGGGPSGAPVDQRPNFRGGSRSYVLHAVEASLKRLNTDYIDLYQIHVPDPHTPIEETLRALDDLVCSGKVRYIGCSNLSPWQTSEALWTSKYNDLSGFVTTQSLYNILQREIEAEMVPCCEAHGLGIIPWGPLAGGFLSGKYRRNQPFPNDSLLASKPFVYQHITTDANWDKLAKFQEFSAARGKTISELAIAWLLAQPHVCSVIPGVSRPEQFEVHVKAAEWRLDAAELAEIDRIYAGGIEPPPKYSLR